MNFLKPLKNQKFLFYWKHSRPQMPRSFWSAPKIATSGRLAVAVSNNGGPRITDFPSLCACSETSLTNLIGSGLNLLCLQIHSKPKPECRWTWPEGQRSRFLVLTKTARSLGTRMFVSLRSTRAADRKIRHAQSCDVDSGA